MIKEFKFTAAALIILISICNNAYSSERRAPTLGLKPSANTKVKPYFDNYLKRASIEEYDSLKSGGYGVEESTLLTETGFASTANNDLKPLNVEQVNTLLKPFVNGNQNSNFVVIVVSNPSDPFKWYALGEPAAFVIVAKLKDVSPMIGLPDFLKIEFKEFSSELAENVIRSLYQSTAKLMNISIEKISERNLYGVYQGPQRGIIIGTGMYSSYKTISVSPLSDFEN